MLRKKKPKVQPIPRLTEEQEALAQKNIEALIDAYAQGGEEALDQEIAEQRRRHTERAERQG